MRLFGRNLFLFGIEKKAQGQYLNSPRVWKHCGYIRAANRTEAYEKACYAVGSSAVRVIPEEPLP